MLTRALRQAYRPPCTLARALHASPRSLAILGLRAEDPARIWERRAALSPVAIEQLVADGHDVLVEQCAKRAIPTSQYEQAGATIVQRLDPRDCDVVVGVKEPVASTLPTDAGPSSNKPAAHLAFFHVHKGQTYNLPLLRTLLESSSTASTRFIDYELITSAPSSASPARSDSTTAPVREGKRTIGFGFLAGYSGMADGLSQLGTKLLAAKGLPNPFLSLVRPLQAGRVSTVESEIRRVGEEIRRGALDGLDEPLVFTISGRGKVGSGARKALDELGVQWVKADQLAELPRGENASRTVYACHLELGDYLVHRDGQPFDREEYRLHPSRFDSVFHSKIAPFTTVLLNGGFWHPDCPRLLTTAQLAELQQNPSSRLVSIVDVSCDFGGGLEFVKAATTLDDPIVQYEAAADRLHRDAAHPSSTQISSVEILPSAFPLDATEHFSAALLPYVQYLLEDPRLERTGEQGKEVREALQRATLVKDGGLAKGHEGLYDLLADAKVQARRKKAVVLGAGLVAGPAVRTLAARKELDVVLASNDLPAAELLSSTHRNVIPAYLDAGDAEALKSLISGADVVLSLLPAPMHVKVAELCIQHGVSLVTASYTSPEMRGLHERAAESDVVLLNELGLDPGIDHVTAMRLIQDARKTGNKISSFVSFCGGLPSPELSNGPLGYKFSWSPRGVLTAALNPAAFRLSSRDVTVPGDRLLTQSFSEVPLLRGFAFEGVANRDSLSYIPQYGLEEDIPTLLRGTLRYPGFSRVVDVFKRVGLLSLEPLDELPTSWTGLVEACLRRNGSTVSVDEALRTTLAGTTDAEVADVLSTMQDLALLPSPDGVEPADLPALPSAPAAPLDLLSTLLANRLRYLPDERDAVVLHHEVTTRSSAGDDELFTSTLVQYGTDEASAMATTVGVPIALGALLVLDGKIAQRGVVSPTSDEVWRPLLRSLEETGIRCIEGRKPGSRGVLATLEKTVNEPGWAKR